MKTHNVREETTLRITQQIYEENTQWSNDEVKQAVIFVLKFLVKEFTNNKKPNWKYNYIMRGGVPPVKKHEEYGFYLDWASITEKENDTTNGN